MPGCLQIYAAPVLQLEYFHQKAELGVRCHQPHQILLAAHA
jgi:hypothetical protein